MAEHDPTSLWEDEESHQFYEHVTDIKPFVPAVLYEGKKRGTSESSDTPAPSEKNEDTPAIKEEDTPVNKEEEEGVCSVWCALDGVKGAIVRSCKQYVVGPNPT